MEENQTNTSTQKESGSSKKWVIIAVIGIIVILIAAGGGFLFLNSNKNADTTEEVMEGNEEGNLEESPEASEPEAMAPESFKDGTYTATGTYSYHSGEESIEVTLTLEDGVITESKVVAQAEVPVSKKMQEDFIANYESEVVGKNINEVELGKISGSSLTPLGFNAAVEEIKAQASQG